MFKPSLAWLWEGSPQQALSLHRARQLQQSLDIMNQLVNEHAHRPESVRLLRQILRQRSEEQATQGRSEISQSG